MFENSSDYAAPADGIGIPDHGTPVSQVDRVIINNKEFDCARTAELLYAQGITPVPLRPWSNLPAVELERWKAELSEESIRRHWRTFPRQGLGFIKEGRE
jgi:hypothetical protein